MASQPIQGVLPELVSNQDNQNCFVFRQAYTKDDTWRIIDPSSLPDRGTRSIYTATENQCHMNGICVKLMFLFTAAGQMASILIKVCGLSFNELPRNSCPNSMLIFKIPGLAPGASTNPYNKDYGYVCFVSQSGSNELEKLITEWHNENIRQPFIEQQQTCLLQRYTPGSPVPDYLQSVGWIDREWGQYFSITNEKNLEKASLRKHLDCKGNQAQTGTEQAADLSRVFPAMNRLQKITTMNGSQNPLKSLLESEFTGNPHLF